MSKTGKLCLFKLTTLRSYCTFALRVGAFTPALLGAYNLNRRI